MFFQFSSLQRYLILQPLPQWNPHKLWTRIVGTLVLSLISATPHSIYVIQLIVQGHSGGGVQALHNSRDIPGRGDCITFRYNWFEVCPLTLSTPSTACIGETVPGNWAVRLQWRTMQLNDLPKTWCHYFISSHKVNAIEARMADRKGASTYMLHKHFQNQIYLHWDSPSIFITPSPSLLQTSVTMVVTLVQSTVPPNVVYVTSSCPFEFSDTADTVSPTL